MLEMPSGFTWVVAIGGQIFSTFFILQELPTGTSPEFLTFNMADPPIRLGPNHEDGRQSPA